MFESTLIAAHPDHERLHRLTLAAALALASTSAVLAGVWTLEQLGVDRVPGPGEQFELLQFSLLPPPEPLPPPPPPPELDKNMPEEETRAATPFTIEELVEPPDDFEVETRPNVLTQPDTRRGPIVGDGILIGVGCPPGGCTGVAPTDGGGGTCKGFGCATSAKPTVDAAPKEVEFSELRCLACADPDPAALRKSVASLQDRRGGVTVKFCVDAAGRVESSSIKVSRSFGVGAVDQVVTAAIKQWRFSPLKVGGKPHRACSRAKFNIRFD